MKTHRHRIAYAALAAAVIAGFLLSGFGAVEVQAQGTTLYATSILEASAAGWPAVGADAGGGSWSNTSDVLGAGDSANARFTSSAVRYSRLDVSFGGSFTWVNGQSSLKIALTNNSGNNRWCVMALFRPDGTYWIIENGLCLTRNAVISEATNSCPSDCVFSSFRIVNDFTAASQYTDIDYIRLTGVELVPTNTPAPTSTNTPSPTPFVASGSALSLIGRDRVSDYYPWLNGAGYTIAILDSGIAATHPKFFNRIIDQVDIFNGDSVADDIGGHGTVMASVVVDTCPACSVVSVKVFDDGGPAPEDIEDGLAWVEANRERLNIVAVLMAYGTEDIYTSEQTSMYTDEINRLHNAGVVLVASAGNSYHTYNTEGVVYPAAAANVIGVGAVFDRDVGAFTYETATASTTGPDRIAPFSNRDTNLSEIFAPGVYITVADYSGTGDTVAVGSSASAAYVAGAVALIQQAAVEAAGELLSADGVRNVILSSAEVIIDGDDEDDNVVNTGENFLRLNMLGAVQASLGGNVIQDGGMEQYPTSDHWYLVGDPATYKWGRVRDVPTFWDNNSDAACGNGYQVIGFGVEGGIFGLFGTEVLYGGIAQQFAWPGGDMVVQVTHKANFSPIGPSARLKVRFINIDTAQAWYFGGEQDLDYIESQIAWTSTVGGLDDMPAGRYFIDIGDYGGHDGFNHTLYVDDVVVVSTDSDDLVINSNGCSTGSDLPAVTPTSTHFDLTINCNFENGSIGWELGSDDFIDDTPPEGVVGDHYLASVRSFPIRNQTDPRSATIYWPGGYIYLTAYARSQALVGKTEITARAANSSLYTVLVNQPLTSNWTQVSGYANLAAGNYYISLSGGEESAIYYDAVLWSGNGYVYCANGPTYTPSATPTPTRTLTGTQPTSTVTRTATRTPTPDPSRTPFITITPRPPVYPSVPPETSTSPATSTQTGPELTATHQGTDIPTYTPYPTYTPFPGTGSGGGGIVLPPDPPQQPPASWDAECVPPLMGGIDVAGWAAYQQCRAQSWVSWSPTNSAQVGEWSDITGGREPFGTIEQAGGMLTNFNGMLNGVDWASTGASCSNQPPDPQKILRQAQGILLGDLRFDETEFYFSATCNMAAAPLVGPIITRGLCIAVNILCLVGLMQWFQWLANIFVVVAFFMYLKVNWIDKAVQ